MKFSIVIPTYNQLELLKRALGSVMQQEHADYEVIITDDSTNDLIKHYVQSLGDARIAWYRHQGNGNAAENWNYGLQQATGQYIILMHHDEAMTGSDYLCRLQQQMAAGAGIAISQVAVITGSQKKSRRLSKLLLPLTLRWPALLFLVNAIGPTACLTFSRQLMQPFNTRLRWLVDVEWYYRLLRSRKGSSARSIQSIPSLIIESRHGHEGQITGSLNIADTFRSDKTELMRLYRANIPVRLMLLLYQWKLRL